MKLVKDVMVRDVMTISPFASIREALSQMKQHSVKSLVVEKTSEHDAWGLITYTNVLKTVIAEDGDIDACLTAECPDEYVELEACLRPYIEQGLCNQDIADCNVEF